MLLRNEVLSAFDGEDDVYVDLCIGVGHSFRIRVIEISPLWGFIAPTGLLDRLGAVRKPHLPTQKILTAPIVSDKGENSLALT